MTVKEKFDLICERFNIKEYHIAGYKGQGVKIAITESTKDDHGVKVYRTIKTYAPEVEVISYTDTFGESATGDSNTPETIHFPKFVDWCIKEKVDIATCSQNWEADKKEELEAIERLYNAGIIFFNLAHNDGEEITLGKSKKASCIDEGVITVSSVSIADTGKIKYGKRNYGSAVDVLGVGEYLPIQYEGGSWDSITGTSFATPLLASMFALMKCAGINVNSKNAMDLIEIHSEELIYKDRTYNLFVLPPLVPYAELEKELEEIEDWKVEFNRSWNKAIELGVTDGTRRNDPITRNEFIVILDRLGLLQ